MDKTTLNEYGYIIIYTIILAVVMSVITGIVYYNQIGKMIDTQEGSKNPPYQSNEAFEDYVSGNTSNVNTGKEETP